MVRPTLPNRHRRTGRIRFRRSRLGRLIPQVEEAVYRGRAPAPPGKDHPPEDPIYHRWRDADKSELDHLARHYYRPECPEQ